MRKSSQFLIFLAIALPSIGSATAGAQTNFPSVNIGSSATSAAIFSLPSAVTLGSISVVTQGATGLDFTNAGTGTCVAGTSYAASQTCTVDVNFKPVLAGARFGEASLEDGSGNVIAAVTMYGIGAGPQIAFGPGTPVAIDPMVNGIALFWPYGVAVDGRGNLFIADGPHHRVVEAPAGGGAPIAIDPVVDGLGLVKPAGLAVDGAGDLFIADLDSNLVVEVPAGGGAAIALSPIVNGVGLKYPCGMAVDGKGNLFIADVDNGRLVEVPADGGPPIAIDPTVNGKKLIYPVALAMDSAGDLFISDQFANQVVEVPAGGGAAIAIDPVVNGESLKEPYGIAVDAAGDLFIADSYNNRLVEAPAGGGAAIVLDTTVNGEGLNDPIGIAISGAGDLFIADSNNDRVVEVQRSQPPALNFAATAVGSTSSDSPQTVQVENIGNAPLTFPIPSAGDNPGISANFMLTGSGASDCPLLTPNSSAPDMLAAGASCLLHISFVPASAGSAYGALTLTDNSLNAAAPGYATQSILLSGNAPVASLSATSLAFGLQQVGTASATQQVTLTNTGSAALAMVNTSVTGANASSFVFPNSCGSSLAPGANCVIQGNLTPAAVGALTAVVNITDSAPGSPQTIILTGTGVYPATVTVTPASSSVNGAQALTVTVAVSGGGGNPTPTGSVTLTIESYTSAPATLSNGSATIDVPAGSLTVGTDSIVAAYTPDSSSASIYESASGSSSIMVTASSTATAPLAATGAASAITANSATLAGTVNPNGADTHTWFLYGASNTLSGASQTPSVDLGSTTAVDAVSVPISGLSDGTTYFYQVVAQNSVGITSGSIESFATPDLPYFSVFTGAGVSVTPGATTGNTSTITVAPFADFTGTVGLSCSITPAAASNPPTCSVPASITISGTTAETVSLTVNTTAATALNKQLRLFWPSAGGTVLACILLFGIPARRRKWRTLPGLLLLLIALTGGVLSCGGNNASGGGGGGGGNPGTPAGSYTITVAGISGSTTATGTVALSVQ